MKRILFLVILLLSLTAQNSYARYISRAWCHAGDSMTVKNDTIISDSVVRPVVDSLTVPIDTISVATIADTSSVTTTDTLPTQTDSLRNPFVEDAKAPKREYKHFKVNKRSDKDYNNLCSYYKSIIKVEKTPDACYLETLPDAYMAWKEAFNSRENRSVELYFDGVTIIMGCVMNDTTNKNYDNIKLHREEIEELYDLAVENVDDINSQLDLSGGADSITVAELRSQQISYYNELWNMDSIFHSTDQGHNKYYSVDSIRTHWANKHVHDSLEVYKLYPWYCDMVYSESKHINPIHLQEFAGICHMKIVYDIRKYDLENKGGYLANYAKEKLEADKAQCEARFDYFIEIETDPKLKHNYAIYKDKNVDDAFKEALSAFIDGDLDKLEEHWKQELAKPGTTIEDYQRLYNGNLKKSLTSETYLLACRYLYDREPTYELALDIIKRCIAQKEFASSIKYYKDAFEFEEFKQLSDFEKAKEFVKYAGVQMYANQPNVAYKSLCKAMELAPDYPEPYYFIAEMWTMYAWNKTNSKNDPWECFRYCIASDYYNKALWMLKNLNAMTDIKSDLVEKRINDRISMCATHFPDYDKVHNCGYEVKHGKQTIPFKIGESLTVPRWGGKFTSVIRARK